MPQRLLFPTLVVAPAIATALLVRAGVPPALAMTGVVVALIALVTALERLRPFRAEWAQQPRGETAVDLAYIAFASVPDRGTRLAVEAGALILIGSAVTETSVQPVHVALAVFAFLVSDLGKYLIHRASHTSAWLFRFHVAHHQPDRLTALNALRLHPVNVAYNAAIDALPVVLLGVPPAAAAILATLRATVGVLQHANLDLEDGRQWLVNAPSYHRTHHDVEVREAQHNFASSLLIWDCLFGTLRRAKAPAVVGVPARASLPRGLVGQLLHPFCGERLTTSCIAARWAWASR